MKLEYNLLLQYSIGTAKRGLFLLENEFEFNRLAIIRLYKNNGTLLQKWVKLNQSRSADGLVGEQLFRLYLEVATDLLFLVSSQHRIQSFRLFLTLCKLSDFSHLCKARSLSFHQRKQITICEPPLVVISLELILVHEYFFEGCYLCIHHRHQVPVNLHINELQIKLLFDPVMDFILCFLQKLLKHFFLAFNVH